MYDKFHIQNWINIGVPTLITARTFLDDLKYYVFKLGDPSLIAMTGGQARAVMQYIEHVGARNKYDDLYRAMQERVRISELQGEYSLAQKRKLREARMNTT